MMRQVLWEAAAVMRANNGRIPSKRKPHQAKPQREAEITTQQPKDGKCQYCGDDALSGTVCLGCKLAAEWNRLAARKRKGDATFQEWERFAHIHTTLYGPNGNLQSSWSGFASAVYAAAQAKRYQRIERTRDTRERQGWGQDQIDREMVRTLRDRG